MQTVEIDREVFEDMIKSMRFPHSMVSRMWKQLHAPVGSGKWLTPYAAANALRISTRQLQTLESSGKIGFFQEAGGNCLYSENELGRYLEDNRVEADGRL